MNSIHPLYWPFFRFTCFNSFQCLLLVVIFFLFVYLQTLYFVVSFLIILKTSYTSLGFRFTSPFRILKHLLDIFLVKLLAPPRHPLTKCTILFVVMLSSLLISCYELDETTFSFFIFGFFYMQPKLDPSPLEQGCLCWCNRPPWFWCLVNMFD